jgi:DNA-binding transcriptional ArsR family regulator
MIKAELFDKELQKKAEIFKALAHPARLAILKYLAEVKVCISGDISEELPLSRTTVHQHLLELKKIGLIQGQIQGIRTNYCLNCDNIQDVKKIIDSFLTEIDCNINSEC